MSMRQDGINNKIIWRNAFLLLFAALFLLVPGRTGAEGTYPSYYGPYGSAGFIGGRTVVVSIFADDKTTSWNFPVKTDAERTLLRKIHDRMKTGFEWLEQQAARYGIKSEFIWDYDLYGAAGGLSYYKTFSEDLIGGNWNSYMEMWNYIEDELDVRGILDMYAADQIVFAVHLNAPNYPDATRSFTWTANYRDLEEYQLFYEIIIFVPYGHGRENTPAVYAHELLHTFGANDLYRSGDIIPQTYVDYLDRSNAFDLMNSCYYSEYDRVTNRFSDVDAYFCGLISTCEDVRKYGLGPNIFEYVKTRELVIRCYRYALGREGSADEIGNWMSFVIKGNKTAADIAHDILDSKEFRNRGLGNEEIVKAMYRIYFNREADAGGLAYWTGMLNRGERLETVETGFAGSDEFKSLMLGK